MMRVSAKPANSISATEIITAATGCADSIGFLEYSQLFMSFMSGNTTRFGVFSRVENTSLGKHMGDHFILLFTIRNEVGSLARTIDIIGRYGFNMRTLRSRPVKELLWEYYFYLEIEGDIHTPAGQEMLRQLQPCCDRIKIAGSFSRNSSLEEA